MPSSQFLIARFIAIGSVIGLAFLTIYIQYTHNKSLEKDLSISRLETSRYKQVLAIQNAQILKNKSDYDEAIKKLPTVLKTIETKYKTQYQTIYQWRDNNETDDCNSSIQLINDFKF